MESWKAEFYPKAADTITDDEEALEFSIQKWKGYRRNNLARHGVEISHTIPTSIVELRTIQLINNRPAYEKVDEFRFDSSTCPLCVKHMYVKGQCGACPITELTGTPCHLYPQSVYGKVRLNCDPEPMITLLELTLERLRARKKTKTVTINDEGSTEKVS